MSVFQKKITMVECENCKSGWSINEEDSKNLEKVLQCDQCGTQFSVLTGIKNNLKSENTFSLFQFISTAMLVAEIEIKVGFAQYINIPKYFNKVFKVFITPQSPCYVEAVNISNEGFLLMSSCDINSNDCVIGESVVASISVYGKHKGHGESWKELLAYSRELYISGDYLASIILVEIAFESFIDNVLSDGFIKKGMDKDSISRFLVATEMPVKVNPLMYNLYGKKLSASVAWKDWEKKVLKWRNDIAHGSKISASKEEAKLAYDTIIEAIFHFNETILSIEE